MQKHLRYSKIRFRLLASMDVDPAKVLRCAHLPHAVDARVLENAAVLLDDMDVQAVVGPQEVTNPFMVTEAYIKESGKWKLAQLTFSHLLRPVRASSERH